MKGFRVVLEEDIRRELDMGKAIELMREAFLQISGGVATVPVRTVLDEKGGRGRALFMPAYSSGYGLFGLKMVSVFPQNPKIGLPSIQGKMLVMEANHGTPVGLLDAEYLTALRTGAASGYATGLLANPGSSVLAIFGTGTQALTQVEAVTSVRHIKKLLVYGTSQAKAEAFCEKMNDQYKLPCVAPNGLAALMEADIICTATTSTHPVFELGHIKPGVHINGIGSFKPEIREIPAAVIRQSLLIVDQRAAALSEAGDLIIPIKEGVIGSDHIHAELGEVASGIKTGRTDANQITVFKSVGNAVQDLAMAAFLLA